MNTMPKFREINYRQCDSDERSWKIGRKKISRIGMRKYKKSFFVFE